MSNLTCPNSTTDNEFDVLYAEFNTTAMAAAEFLKAWNENFEWFEKQRANLNQALGAVQIACGNDPSKPVVALQRYGNHFCTPTAIFVEIVVGTALDRCH